MGIFAIGERVKIVGMTSGHQQPIGTQLTVRGYNGMFVMVQENAFNYYEVDLESCPWTVEDAEKQMKAAEMEYLRNQARFEYVRESLDAGDEPTEDGFRTTTMLKIISSDLPDGEKVKRVEAIYRRAA